MKTQTISIFFPFAMTGAMFLQFFLYRLYNTSMHPFKVLVENYQEEVEMDQTNIELWPMSTNDSKIPDMVQKTEDVKDPDEPEVSGEVTVNTDSNEVCMVIVDQLVSGLFLKQEDNQEIV